MQKFDLELRKVRHLVKFHNIRGYDYKVKVHKLEQQLSVDLAVQAVYNTISGKFLKIYPPF